MNHCGILHRAWLYDCHTLFKILKWMKYIQVILLYCNLRDVFNSLAIFLKACRDLFQYQAYLSKHKKIIVRINSLRLSDAYMHQQNNHHWLKLWLVTWSTPSHYLNRCWNIVNLTLGNKIQWNLNRYLYVFIQENAFENVVWKWSNS